MFEEIIKLTENWKELKISYFAVGFQLNTEIDIKNIYNLFDKVKKIFPTLTKYDQEEKNTHILKSDELTSENHVRLIIIVPFKKIIFAWTKQSDSIIDKSIILNVMNCVQDELNVNAFKTSNIEFQFLASSEKKINHFKVIHNTFYNSDMLGDIIDVNNITKGDIAFGVFIEKDRIAAIQIGSDLTIKEVENRDFNNCGLSSKLGIAKIDGFLEGEFNLAERIMENAEKGILFVKEKFIPKVLNPLDENLAKEKEEE